MEKIFKPIAITISISLLTASGYLVYNHFYGDNIEFKKITTSIVNESNLKPSPPEFTALIKSAQDFNQKNDYANSIKAYLSANKINPSSSIPYLGISRIYYKLEKFDYAEQNMTNAYIKGGLDTNGLNLYARILIQNKEILKAEEVIKKINSPNTETVFLSSIIQLLNKNSKEFKNTLTKLTKVETKDKYTELSKTLIDSIKVYETFTDSPISYLLVLIAENLTNNSEYIIARPLLFESIAEKNDYRDAYVVLGYSLLLSNKLPDAEQSLQKALQIDPYLGATHFYYGLSLLKQDQYQKALDSFLQAEGTDFEPKFELYKNIANASFEVAEYQKSYEYFLKANSINTLKLPEASKLAETLIERLSKPVDALNLITSITANYPNEAQSLALMGYAQIANQKYPEARKNLLESIKLNPNSAETYIYIAKLNAAENKKPEALNNLEEAKKLTKNQKVLDRIKTEAERINNLP